MMMSVTLNSPLSEEDLDKIYDVDMDNTSKVTFHTKHGKEVEFVKVVRCKDCKLSEHDIDITEHWCCYWDNKTLENGYCSYGERKDDEQNGSID